MFLYGIVNNNMPPHVDGDWVKLRIRVAGRHIQTSIDNQVVIDWWEPKDPQGEKATLGRHLCHPSP